MVDKKNDKKLKDKVDDIVEEENPETREKLIDNFIEKYNHSKEELKEISDKTKKNIKKNPYESIAIATGVGTILGIGFGALMYNSFENRNKINFNEYKKNLSKSSNWDDLSKIFRNDVKKKPYESLSIAMGLGVLIGVGLNSLNGCNKK